MVIPKTKTLKTMSFYVTHIIFMCDRDTLYTLRKYSTKINDALLMLHKSEKRSLTLLIP